MACCRPSKSRLMWSRSCATKNSSCCPTPKWRAISSTRPRTTTAGWAACRSSMPRTWARTRVDEQLAPEEAHRADHDQVDGHDVVEQPGNQQDQDAGDERGHRSDVGVESHGGLP